MSRWDRYAWFPRPAPRRPPPERGIKVRKLGATWWGRRWIEALEGLSWEYSNRLTRGRTYARAGRVHDLEIRGGMVEARVTGSRATPYHVNLRVAPLSAPRWNKAITALAEQALFAAQLLAATMPEGIDQAFRATGRSLFPEREDDLETSCSCPDWANPCKHVAAVHYVLAEAFDRDPFLLFELRGRGRGAVLDELRGRRSRLERKQGTAPGLRPDSLPHDGVSLAGVAAGEFERFRGTPAPLCFNFDPPAVSGALLRQLGKPPGWSLDATPADLLGPLYAAAAALARDLALRGEEKATPAGDARPGRDATGKSTRSRRRSRS